MKSHIYSFVAATLVLAQTLWLSTTPALAAAPRQAINDLLKPTIVASCPGFSPFDAAGVLQEAVNSTEPIGNLLFGPLDDETLSLGTEGGMQGFCGYVSATSATGGVDESQTHLLTTIDADHAIVARHLTIDVGTSTFPAEWVDLYALVALVGAANPEYDREAISDTLYNAAGYIPFPEALYTVAADAPSFKAEWLEVGDNQPYEELLWLWQTLDDGYFSLLLARTGLEYSLVAARLGPDVNEQRVQGNSLVILDQIAAGDGAEQEATTAETASETTASEPASLDCALLSEDDAATLVGETALAYPVADEISYGCKYLPESTTDASTADDGSPQFRGAGTLVVVLSNDVAVQSFGGLTQGVEDAGASKDEVDAIRAALEAGDFGAGLQALAQVDLQTDELHITALPAVSDNAVWLRITDRGERVAIFMRTLPDGQILQIMVLRPDLAEAEASAVAEIDAAIGEVGVRALTAFAQTDAESPSQEAATSAQSSIEGVKVYRNLPSAHAETPITYDPIPPVGGEHSSEWINCGVYTVPLPNEMAVHSLEHGAVWITYQPDLPAKQVAILQALTKAGEYRLLSPFPDLPSPVVASAWGYQLHLDSADDPRLLQFVTTYENHPDGPEVGAPCDQGVGDVAEQDTTADGAAEEAAEQEATTAETASETAASEPTGLDCALLSDKDAATLVGETALAYPEVTTKSDGCMYLPASAADASTADGGAPQLVSAVAWVEVWSKEYARELFNDIPMFLAAENVEKRKLESVLDAAYAGDLVATLQALTQIDLQTKTMHIKALPEVSDDAVLLRYITPKKERVSVFMRSLPDGAVLQLIIRRRDLNEAKASEIEEIEAAMRKVAARVLTDFAQAVAEQSTEETPEKTAIDTSDAATAEALQRAAALLDLRTFPAPESAEAPGENTITYAWYLVPQELSDVLEFYRKALSTQGWQEDESLSFADEERAKLYFEQEGYRVGLTLRLEDQNQTNVELRNLGNLDAASVPTTEDAEVIYQTPFSQYYATALAMDEAVDFLHETLEADGWQETTSEDDLSSNSKEFQNYTFVRQGILLTLQLTKGEKATDVIYYVELISLD